VIVKGKETATQIAHHLHPFLLLRNVYFYIFTASLIALILTASRVSVGAYAISVGLFLLFVRKFKLLTLVVILTMILAPASENLTQRITRSFSQTKVFVDPSTGEIYVPSESTDVLPVGTSIIGSIDKEELQRIAERTKNTDNSKEASKAKALIREEIKKKALESGQNLTRDQIEEQVNKAFTKTVPMIARVADVSQSTRFQVEWPRAINAFLHSPILGRGPSSLTEATDGDYFRWLGEMGLLGTSLFLGIIFSIVVYLWKGLKYVTKNETYLYYGFMFGTLALFVNATYIDVFEASKVAYTYWLVAGVFVASITVAQKEHSKH
jgi:hypothetical protein